MSDQPEMDETQDEAGEFNSAFEEFMYHQRRALEETGKALEALLPEGFRVHGGNASKEFIKGFRVLTDAWIDDVRSKRAKMRSDDADENYDDDAPPSTTGDAKVKVEVD